MPQLRPAVLPRNRHLPLGRHLADAGVISPAQLIHALNQQLRLSAPLGEILIADGLVDETTILDALALQYNVQRVDLSQDLPDPRLTGIIAPEICVQHRIIPWLLLGDVLFVATSRPDLLKELRRHLPANTYKLLPVIAPVDDILTCITGQSGSTLARRAETRVKPEESCRNWGARRAVRGAWLIGGILAGLVAAVLSPVWTFTILLLVATITLALSIGLKTAAFLAQITSKYPPAKTTEPDSKTRFRLPRVSIMVPLLREKEIAQALIARLSRLTYPKALLDIVLVLEERDEVTRQTLANTNLPPWMKVIEVPCTNGVTTKPRALNYALDFCRGSIIGVWDAEDLPAPDQIEIVAHHFHCAPPEVVCLQGILDYYNPRANWLSRCFTIEYATWWRIIMPGIARLGLVIPLGGTTLFFRRDALEKVRGWDAHNVTEDADLGFRLARYGYRTQMIPTVTHEEATCRPWAWVRQRSRWLKGFMVTYLVHMRSPRRLLADLGPLKFWGFQVFFIAALSQFLLAPLLWSLWLVLLGMPHPLQGVVNHSIIFSLAGFFALCELVSICFGLVAVSGKEHRHLMAWAPTLMLYFPLGTLACYKAVYELVAKPFFWDKTQHGHSLDQKTGIIPDCHARTHPASNGS